MINQNLSNFIDKLNERIKFQVVVKEKSLLMKVISYLMFFNKTFLTDFITTIDDKIYIPQKVLDKFSDEKIAAIICHEVIHIDDSNKMGPLFKLSYTFPQNLIILSLLGFLGFLNSWMFFFFLFLIFSLPIPSPGRKSLELRAYKVSLLLNELMFKKYYDESQVLKLVNKSKYMMNEYFVGPYYYYMSRSSIINDLDSYKEMEKEELVLFLKNKYIEFLQK